MLNLTNVRPTSKSPLFDAPHLSGEVVRREWLTRSDQEEMYELLEAYFENTSRQQFEHDLGEKNIAILLRDGTSGRVAGFSTLMKIRTEVDGRDVTGFFSGDTIVARERWGSSLLGRLWLRTVFCEAERFREESPQTLFYWFLICSGYKTWRYLPVFFRNYTPHPRLSEGAFDRRVLETLAARKFGDEYQRETGIVRFRRANPLRAGVADVTEHRLRDPMVEFFVRANPGHVSGDELACLAPICPSNLTPAGRRLLHSGVRE